MRNKETKNVMVVGSAVFCNELVKEDEVNFSNSEKYSKTQIRFHSFFKTVNAMDFIQTCKANETKIDAIIYHDDNSYMCSAEFFSLYEKELKKSTIFISVTNRNILPVTEELLMIQAGVDYIFSSSYSASGMIQRLRFILTSAQDISKKPVKVAEKDSFITKDEIIKSLNETKKEEKRERKETCSSVLSGSEKTLFVSGKNKFDKDEYVDLDTLVARLLKEIGSPTHVKGYHYTREAILMVYRDPNYTFSITKSLYPDLAKKLKTEDKKVERCIRNFIELTFFNEHRNQELINEIFGYTYLNREKKRPTNTEFFCSITEYLKVERAVG